jgi:NADH-quinone oxidoreductase E subunit
MLEMKDRIEELILRYPTKKAALLPALWVAQEVNGGWLSASAMAEVARLLELPATEVQGVATFYTMYNKSPRGKHAIEICHNVPCMALGAEQLILHGEKTLGIATGETTSDGQFTLARVECLGACCNAPVVQVGGTYYEDVTPAGLDKIVESLKTAESEVERPPQGQISEMRDF